jgi:large repetitive protein
MVGGVLTMARALWKPGEPRIKGEKMKRLFLVLVLGAAVGLTACSKDSGGDGLGGNGGTGAVGGSGGTGGEMIATDGGPDVYLGAPECSDNEDNDGDGLIDLDDPGCENAVDNDERQRQCADGVDNDEDGLTDYPADPGCGSFSDNDERNAPQPPECADGVDNDRNGYVDEQDPGCASVADMTERAGDGTPQCSDRLDNDGDGVIDFPAELGCSAAGDEDESDPRTPPACANGNDDDMDGYTDYPDDPGCFGRGDRDEGDKPVTPSCADGVDNDRDGQIDYPADEGCIAASDSNEKGTCLDEYDPPRIQAGQLLVVDSSRGVFQSAGTCGGTGSPETVVVYRLTQRVEALVISTSSDETSALTSLYVRYQDCLVPNAEVVCQREAPNTPVPGQNVRIEDPALGEYFIFVDGVAGAGGPVGLSVEEVPPAACLNGIDDDADGATDYPVDPGCALPSDRDETDPAEAPVCANGADDDGDGQIDYPQDVGCVAASFSSESDLCGVGVRVNEYLFDSNHVMGNTDGPDATNSLDPNQAGCGRTNKPEVIYYYRNPYQSRLTISTDHPETMANTAVYLRSECTNGRTELACSDGDDAMSNRGQIVVDGVAPGNYFIVVDTSVGIGGAFKLTVVSEYDEPQCADHIDNDGDGRIDDDDAGCSSLRDRSERQSSGTPECNNGEDDDGDGRIDWPLDPGCQARGDASEEDPDVEPACSNGVDDDGDGHVDIPADPGCTSRGDDDELDLRVLVACSNGRDDDGDGLTDYGEDPGCDFAGDRTE